MTKRKEILMSLTPFPLIALLGISPILVAMLAGFIASLLGHELNESTAPDIPVIGGILYSMGVMAWFSLVTVPTAGLGLLIYLFVFISKVLKIAKGDTKIKIQELEE